MSFKFVSISGAVVMLAACAPVSGTSHAPPAAETTTAGARAGNAETAPPAPAAATARPGDQIVVRAAGARFVPMHSRPAPSFFRGVGNDSSGDVVARSDDGRWLQVKLSNGAEGWVRAAHVIVTARGTLPPLPGSGTSADTGKHPELALGPMIGHVSPRTARIWIKSASGGRAAIMIGRRYDLGDGRTVDGPRLEPAHDFAATIDIDGLSPATRYFFVVVLNGAPIRGAPYDSFMTAPRVGARGKFRFAFVSCVGAPRRAAEGWQDLAAISFDLLLQLGDNHYANSTEPRVLRSNYRAHRSSDAFKAISARVPILGIWDDHDFARNNSDGTAPGKEDSLATFKEHWPNPAFAEVGEDGVYFKFSRGDVDFFMLDGRYHRSPNRKPDNGSKTMLGVSQLAWLKRGLRSSNARIKFIASGTEWQSFGTTDSWAGFRRERDELFGFIDDNGIEGVVLLSGDRHLTAGYYVLDRFVEITSGPLGSRNIRAKRSPERSFLHDQGRYFTVFDIDTRPSDPVVKLEVHRVGVGLVETVAFPWARINPRPMSSRRIN